MGEESEAEYEKQEEAALAQAVEMSGHVLMIYVRTNEDKVANFNIVLKGQWSMEDKEPEDLIYKRIGPPKNEEAIRSLHSAEHLPAPKSGDTFDPRVLQQVTDRLMGCQGQYQGYFKYQGAETTENFSLLMKHYRTETGNVKRNTFGLCGYGEN